MHLLKEKALVVLFPLVLRSAVKKPILPTYWGASWDLRAPIFSIIPHLLSVRVL